MLPNSASTAWNRFFFTPLDARPVALFRILMGCLCTSMIVASSVNWRRFFHADGIISLASTDLGNTRVNECFGLFYWTEGFIPIEAYWYIALVVSICFTLGFQTRIATVSLLVLLRAMLQRNPYLANGEEMVFETCLIYFAWTDLGAAYSVDAWRAAKRGKPKAKELAGWPIRMMQWNIALIYVISLPYKFAQDPGWVTGDAIHWTVASDMWGPSEYPWITLAFGGLIRKAMTFGTVFIEAFFPIAVWFRRTRRSAIFGIASLHLGIALLIPNVTYFTLSMVCGFAAFLAKEDVDALERAAVRLRSLFQTSNRSHPSLQSSRQAGPRTA